jgi:hypothetical protein
MELLKETSKGNNKSRDEKIRITREDFCTLPELQRLTK